MSERRDKARGHTQEKEKYVKGRVGAGKPAATLYLFAYLLTIYLHFLIRFAHSS